MASNSSSISNNQNVYIGSNVDSEPMRVVVDVEPKNLESGNAPE
ncbi:hypothetical protein imdm_2024 [gamma proteobacterium IMCC2047]|nr:hypothetical protein imdm_2024 [gamma proteobacterium IMCC2047]